MKLKLGDKIQLSPDTRKVALSAIAVFILSLVIFSFFPPQGVDWNRTFYPSSQKILNPYSNETFINIPWITLVLSPFRFFSKEAGKILNVSLQVVIFWILLKQKGGKTLAIFLTFTSFPFLFSLHNASIEWIPALALFFPNALGVIIYLIKPQSTLLIGLDWFYRQKNKLAFVIIPLAWMLVSLLIWPGWPLEMLKNMEEVTLYRWNMSLFPWTIPVGLALVYYIVKEKPEKGELLASLATICLMPYFAPHSVTIPFVLLTTRYPRASIPVWISLWIYPFLEYGLIPILFNIK